RFKIRGTETPPADIVVVDITDQTFEGVRKQWPFPRRFHANVINRARRDGANLVVLDIQFTEPSLYGDADDTALFDACQAARDCVISDTEPGPKGQTRTLGGPQNLKYAHAQVGDG